MVRRGLVRSRNEAHHLITGGRVLLAGGRNPKPSTTVGETEEITIIPGPRFVSRGGEKLAAALKQFPVKVKGARALDIGASTGGFTDCLLSLGATEVVAVDLGTGQFNPQLAARESVTVLEGVDIRDLDPDAVGGTFSLVVADLSFISLCSVARHLSRVTAPGGDAVILVKPQFEVGRLAIGRGVVRDPTLQAEAVAKAKTCLGEAELDTVGEMTSPLLGQRGNQEFFIWAKRR
jgi:23S rRNA (cytidine1920-2'-O)/16S rRNA (cytidine1409-2'-O)-methyltransferase